VLCKTIHNFFFAKLYNTTLQNLYKPIHNLTQRCHLTQLYNILHTLQITTQHFQNKQQVFSNYTKPCKTLPHFKNFYNTLHNSTRFYTILHNFLQHCTQLYKATALQNHTHTLHTLHTYTQTVHNFTNFTILCNVLTTLYTHFTQRCTIAHNSAQLYTTLQNPTQLYTILQNFSETHTTILYNTLHNFKTFTNYTKLCKIPNTSLQLLENMFKTIHN